MKATHTGLDSTRRTQRWVIAALVVFIAFIAAPSFASAASGTGAPSVWTDQMSYAPGGVVGLSGAGFAPGDTVSVSLSDGLSGWTSQTVDETVANDGSFTGAPIALPSTFSSSITATATDAATGASASAVVMETMAPPNFTPTITTDQQDYAPGSVVTVTGSGWPADESLSVFTNDSSGNTWSQTDQITTDRSGAFTDKVTLPLMFISNYTVTAGDGSGLTATTTFTDGNATSVSGTVTDSVTHNPISGATVSCDTTGGCNATFTTTTDASGNYTFSGGNKLTFAGNGPTTLKLNVSSSGYTSGTITINNVSNGDSFANENIALAPSGPTKLAFTTSALTGTVGQCLGPISVQTQNAGGTATNVTAATTVNLATDNGSTGAGAFYSDSGCSSAVATRTISSGSNSASFFYLATGRGSGSHLLTASATSLTSASQTETINKANQATLSITAPTSATFGAADATITTSGGSGTGAVTFDAGASTACSILSGKLHVTSGTGTCSITATKAADANFNSATSAAFPVTINKANQATLSITAPTSATFGAADATITTSGGSGTGAVTFDAGASTACSILSGKLHVTSGTGTCSITATKAADANFNSATSAAFPVTINKADQATLSITAPTSATFGAADATITTSGGSGTGTVSFNAGGSTACSIVSSKLHALSGAGSCSITATKAGDANFNSKTSAAFPITINKKQLDVTASSPADGVYGDPVPTITAGYSGFVTGEGPGDLTAAPSCSTTYTHAATSTPGTYPTSCGGGVSSNYAFSYHDGSFKVGKAPLDVTASSPADGVYGDPVPTISAIYGGTGLNSFVYSQSASDLDTAPSCSTTYTHAATSTPGTYPTSCGGGVSSNYAFSYHDGSFKVGKAPLDVTASSPADGVYGDPVPTISAIYGGTGLNSFVYSQSASDLDTAPSCSTTYTHAATSTPGTYPTSCGGGVSSNYAFSYHDGSFKVGKAPLDVTASSPADGVYGDPVPTISAIYGGTGLNSFVYSQSASDLDTAPSCSTTYTHAATSTPGTYPTSCGGGVSSNYAFSYHDGSFKVGKAPLDVTASSPADGVYGDPVPTISAIYGGTGLNSFVYSQSASDLDTAPSCSTTYTHAATSTPGTYPTSCGGGVSSNYAFSYHDGSFKVGKAPLDVTASSPADGVYGDPVPTISAIYGGTGLNSFVYSQSASDLDTAPSCSTTYTHAATSTPGTYPTSCGGGVSSNYAFSYHDGSFKVGKAPLDVTASSPADGVYGDPVPTISAIYGGTGLNSFVYSQSASDLDTAPSCSTTYTHAATSTPGTYPTSCGGGVSSNYAFSYHDGSFKVGKAPLDVTASSPADGVYGDPVPTISAIYGGTGLNSFVYSQSASDLDTAPSCSTTYTHAATSTPGTYPTSCGGGVSSNYAFSYHDGSFKVGKAPLDVTASSPADGVYGDPVPTISAIYGGTGLNSFVYSQSASDLDTAPSCSTTYTHAATSTPGTYPTSCGGGVSSNYAFSYHDGSFKVGKAPLDVTASSPADGVYGDPVPTISAIYGGTGLNSFVYSQSASDLDTAPSCSTTYTHAATSTPGTYPTSCGGGVSSNYAFSYHDGSFKVGKAPLDVTASSPADGVYGDPVPTISAIYGGTGLNSFVYSQSASDLDTAPSCSTTYTHAATSTPGTYPTSCGGGVSSNYAFSYHDGSFKVGKAPLDVTADADPITVAVDHFSKTYGDANPPFEVRYSGFVFGQNESVLGGTLAFDTTATQASNVGSYGLSPKGLTSSNYAINFNAGTLDINKRPITVKANSVTRVYGDSTPAFSLALFSGSFAAGDGFTNLGTPSYDTGAPVSGHQAVGSYPIVVTGLTSSNYNISYATGSDRGTLTISTRPITVTAQYDNRVYNATTSSNKTPQVTSGSIVSGDMGNFTQAYSTKTAGTGKTLTPSGSVADGNSGNNYAITFANNTTGVITTATLTVNGITANNKVWDGNTSATLNTGAAALAGVLGTDIVTLNTGSAAGAFVSSAVGTWTVLISGLTISNTDAGNYTLTMPTTTASISPWNAAGKGFYAPVGVANSVFTAAPTPVPTLFTPTYVWNTVKGGQTVPLKFNVFAGSVEKTGADAFTNIATAFQAAKMTSCTNAADTDPVDYTITATGSTTLRYDPTGMQWIYNWQTPKVTATACYRTYVTFADGSSIEAFFQLSK